MTQKPPDLQALSGTSLATAKEHCGDFGIRIGRDGTWYYRDSPIGRLPLVKLFASVLRREADGYWLVTPAERGRIEVEDAPFVAVAMAVEGDGGGRSLRFRTNLDQEVTAGPDHPIRARRSAEGESRPYIEVREGLDALIGRSVYYDLVELGEERDGRFGVWSEGTFFPLD